MFSLNDTTLNCKHITKAPQANTTAKVASKRLQSQRTERNCYKKLPTLKNKKR